MPLRFAAIALILAVSACTQPLATLPSQGAPTSQAVAMAQGVCPGADFVTVAPNDPSSTWFRC